MFGEALVFFNANAEAADGFLHVRKQGLQLHSKMRFISAEFKALFTDEIWKKNAAQANHMMNLVVAVLIECPDIGRILVGY